MDIRRLYYEPKAQPSAAQYLGPHNVGAPAQQFRQQFLKDN